VACCTAGRTAAASSGSVQQGAPPARLWALWGVVAGVFTVALGVTAAVLTGPERFHGALLAGVADAAFVVFAVAALMVLGLWRLVGDAAGVPIAAVAALVGLFFVPAVTHMGRSSSGISGALAATSVAVALGVSAMALVGSEVRSDLRPGRLIGFAFAVAIILAVPPVVSPARAIITAKAAGAPIVGIVEAVACFVLAAVMMVKSVRQGRLLWVGAAATLLGAGGASAAISAGATDVAGTWSVLPSLLLLYGALWLAVTVWAPLRRAISLVVLQDVRGRRRWETAEVRLTEASTAYQGFTRRRATATVPRSPRACSTAERPQ